MPAKQKSKYINLYSFHVPVLILATAVLVTGVITTSVLNDRSVSTVLGSKNQGGKEAKTTKRTTTVKEAKTPKSQEHKKAVTEVINTLDTVADTEATAGNTQTSTEVEEVANNVEETASTVVETVDELEKESPFKVFLLGHNYKNLGQLRSTLAHTENSLRKLDKAVDTATPQTTATIAASRENLELQKQTIVSIVTEYESKFSLLGWMSKLINGYSAPANESTSSPKAE